MTYAVEKGAGDRVRDWRVRTPKLITEATSRTSVGDALRSWEAMTRDSAVTLQRKAGNSAVVSLLDRGGAADARSDQYPSVRQRNVQRDVLTTADDPQEYTRRPGGVKTVANSGLTRIEVTGLKYGVKGGHQASYVNSKGEFPSVEK
jgi:hypothetical protein